MISVLKVSTVAGLFGAALLAIGTAAPAQADFSLVTTRAALGTTDSIDWGQLGPESTAPPNPSAVTSTVGISAIVGKVLPGAFARQDQSSLWAGNFAAGDRLLWTHDLASSTNNPITLNFGARGVFGGGAQIQANFPGDFVARVTAL